MDLERIIQIGWQEQHELRRSGKTESGVDGQRFRFGGVFQIGDDPFSEESKKRFAVDNIYGVDRIDFDVYEQPDVQLSGKNLMPKIDSFDELNLPPQLASNLRSIGFRQPTPVQKNAIPQLLDYRDLMGVAQTGSGKTAAFMFPIITNIVNNINPNDYNKVIQGRRGQANVAVFPYALVCAPTRELCIQIYDETFRFCHRTGLQPALVYGGEPVRDQIQRLMQGADILIGAPGRLKDFINRGVVICDEIRHFCLDEADRMLDQGFQKEIDTIYKNMPRGAQVMMFSATFETNIQRLAQNFLKDHVFLAIGRVGSTVGLIEQKLFFVTTAAEKYKALTSLLKTNQGLTLVFVETKNASEMLGNRLQSEGFNSMSMHGNMTQQAREQALRAFRYGRCPVLVGTDVVSRGIDVPNISHVINYDMPGTIDQYTHRIGRTGRAGKKGLATSLLTADSIHLASELVDQLEENDQDVPEWLMMMARTHGPRKSGKKNKAQSDFRSFH